MIKLEVLESPNADYLGEYVFFKNLIYVGSNIDADLYLEDKAASSNHIFIEIVDGQLLAHLGKDAKSFWVDGKLTTKFKFLHPGNILKAGETKFKILGFENSKICTKREILNKNTDELIQSNSPLLGYIKELQKRL